MYGSENNVKELDIEVLTDEAMKLLRMEIDDLYATLGGQLLAQNYPTRVAGTISYLSAVRSASRAKTLYEALPSGLAVTEWGEGLGVIIDELKQNGRRLLGEVGKDLRKALCNEDILLLSDQVNRSIMQIVLMVVAATLRMPREFEAVSVTVSAILLKQGLRNFCRET